MRRNLPKNSSLVTVESSSINIALCSVAETRCNCVQKPKRDS